MSVSEGMGGKVQGDTVLGVLFLRGVWFRGMVPRYGPRGVWSQGMSRGYGPVVWSQGGAVPDMSRGYGPEKYGPGGTALPPRGQKDIRL